MRIAFDIDNVLADTISKWCEEMNTSYGLKIKKKDIKNHKIAGSVDLNPKLIYKKLDQIWENWKKLPMTEDDISGFINELKDKNIIIYVVTCRPLRSIKYVKNWLTFNEINYDEFYPLGPYKSKAVIDSEYLVDDAPEHIKSFISKGEKAFIYDQPWNKHIVKEGVYRIESIKEISDYIF